MGFIKGNKYYKGEAPNLNQEQTSTFRQHDHERQRKDHAKDLLQPYTPDGTPNQDYINAWPEGAKEYGFLPNDNQLRNQ